MRILLATDGSERAAEAAALLSALPLPPETQLHVVTVLPDSPSWSEIFGGRLTDNAALIEAVESEQRERADRTLAQAAAPFVGRVAGLTTSVVSGHPGSEILTAASAWGAELIVIGSRGRTGLSAALLGSTAELVAKRATCSVLVVRGEGRAPARMLLATDGSEHSRQAMERLGDLPLPRSAQIRVLHVTESFYANPGLLPTLREEFERTVQEIRRAQRQNADLLVEGTERFLEATGYRASGETRTGNPAEEILNAAREEATDLVVAGARGMSAAKEFLLGSVSGRLLRYAPCSVLIAR
jgi:nucleotide-binding universal stress UspA family protein